jgi:hypothetical protein
MTPLRLQRRNDVRADKPGPAGNDDHDAQLIRWWDQGLYRPHNDVSKKDKQIADHSF